MAKVKAVRKRCIELNDSVKGATNGLKPYVVISGRLMSRSSSGKIQIAKDRPCAASTQQVQNTDNSLSKNGVGGSHATSLAAVVAAANYAAPSRISQIEISVRNASIIMRLREN